MSSESNIDSVIAEAVNAKVQASVMQALSGDEVLGAYVAAALNQPVEVGDRYRKTQVPFITNLIKKSIQDVTKEAVAALLDEEVERVRDEVRKALRRAVPEIADQLVSSLTTASAKAYGISVSVRLPGE